MYFNQPLRYAPYPNYLIRERLLCTDIVVLENKNSHRHFHTTPNTEAQLIPQTIFTPNAQSEMGSRESSILYEVLVQLPRKEI